jgi:hypothetical protein
VVINTALDAIAHKSVLERSTPLAGEIAASEAYALAMSYLTRQASVTGSQGQQRGSSR